MGTIITILSGKGGVGKTTITALLGAALAKQGHKVLMTDADMGMRDLDLVIGRENDVLYNVVDVQRDKENLEHAIISVSSNLDFLAASQQESWEDVKRKKYGKLIKKLAENYDYVLLDSPAGIGRGIDILVEIADRLIVVTQPTWVALRNAGRIFQMLSEQRKFDSVVVFNNMKTDLPDDFNVVSMMYNVGAEYVGAVLPHCPALENAAQEGLLPVFFDSTYSDLFKPLVSFAQTGETMDENELLAMYQERCGHKESMGERIKTAIKKMVGRS